MPARVVLVHDDPDFVEQAAAALCQAGYDVAGYSDPMLAISALDAANRIEVLVTRATFGPHKPHGLSLALMARAKRPGVRVLFTARPEFEEHTRGIGQFMPLPVRALDLVAAVRRLLQPPALPEA
jgi:DNA-binding response OmpR family regulator